MENPFTLLVAKGNDFCDREKELADLVKAGENRQNIVFYSPRRYGKTSLVTKALGVLQSKGFVTSYIDLYHISSEHDFIESLSNGILNALGRGVDEKTYAQKVRDFFGGIIMGIELKPDGYAFNLQLGNEVKVERAIDEVMEGMRRYVEDKRLKVCIALDEFQAVAELKEGKKIEAKLRSHIQFTRDISYFFVGSRRHILKDMFTNKNRPFYKSADDYQLKEIGKEEFVPYIMQMFAKSGKECPQAIAEKLYDLARGYPFYVQKLAQLLWEVTFHTSGEQALEKAHHILVTKEGAEFEGVWEGLTLVQKSILKAIAAAPVAALYTRSFLEQHGLSIGGAQKAVKVLIERDLVEKVDGYYRLTNPIMGGWVLL